MATRRDEIMGRLGPEDGYVALQAQENTSREFTAGPDYHFGGRTVASAHTHTHAHTSLDYKDGAAAWRYWSIFQSRGADGDVVRDLMRSRNICAKPAFNYELCRQTRYAHQEKQCSPILLEVAKCGTKLVRAVDMVCRREFGDYTACLEGAKGDRTKCMKERTAFDVCTEDF